MTVDASGEFEILNQLGMHARAAAKLVKLAGSFESRIRVEKDGQSADAKSVMGVLLLCGAQGATITVRATGDRAQECVDAIAKLVADRFGEGA